MFSEELYLDLLCSSVREPEPWELYDYTGSRSRFSKKSYGSATLPSIIRVSPFTNQEVVGTLLGFDDFVNMVLEDVVEYESTAEASLQE